MIEAMVAHGRDGAGQDDLVGFCRALLDKDITHGITFIALCTPKLLQAEIQHQVAHYASTADIDKDLAASGLPPMREIFQVEYKREDDPVEVGESPSGDNNT
jgi:hypothetical protein